MSATTRRPGKRLQKWVSVKGTKRDAERRLAELIKDLDTGTFVEPTAITVDAYLDLWLRDYVTLAVRLNTADFYRGVVQRLKDGLGCVRLADLKPQHVQRYYADLLDRGLSAQTCRNDHRVLSQAIGQAVKWDMLSQNVMRRVTPPRVVKPKTRALDASEDRRLLNAADGTDYYLPIHLAVYTGLRRSEILGLRWSDVDLAARTLTVNRTMVSLTGDPAHIDEPKSRRSRRVVAFGRATEAALRPRRSLPHVQVCARANGNELHPGVLTHLFKKIAAACGIHDVRLHDLRHIHASHLLMSGVPVHVVQARLGHASIQTTVDTYGHVLPASDAEAGVVLDRQFASVS
jgi:integrase